MRSADDGSDGVPAWVAVGKKLHWWSESQKKNMSVVVAKVDSKKKQVYVTFEVDQSAYKSVPFAKIGKKDCPLRNPEEKEQSAKKSSEEKKRKDGRDRSATPDWWSKEQMKLVHDQNAKREQKVEEEKKKEEEKKREEQKRRALVEAERKKVQQAFEKRKAEAEAQKLKEEEEWRQKLLKRRAEETAEEEKRLQEKEERRKKRREEKDKKEKEKKPKEIIESVVQPQVTTLPAQVMLEQFVVPPKIAAVNPPPPAVVPLQGLPIAQPWHWPGAPQMHGIAAHSPQMPAGATAMQLMGLGQHAASGSIQPASLGGTNHFAFGAWGAMANGNPGVVPSLAGWGNQWTAMPHTGSNWQQQGSGGNDS